MKRMQKDLFSMYCILGAVSCSQTINLEVETISDISKAFRDDGQAIKGLH